MTRGLPGSGKSTWAKQFIHNNPGWYRWNNDDFCEMLTGIRFGRVDGSFLAKQRKSFILRTMRTGNSIVLDNTNLNPYTTKEVELVLDGLDVDCEIKDVFFPIAIDEAIKRDAKREHPVGPDVIMNMHNKWMDTWPQLKVE